MPADLIGAGWQFPLGFTPSGSVDLASGTQRLEQAMRLILTTYPGERPMRPAFGSYLRDHVFEPVTLDNATRLAAEVRRALVRWEPRVEINDVVVHPAAERPGLLLIDISYAVRGTNDARNLVFPFYQIPEGED